MREKNRNAALEMVRVAGCVLVVALHVRPSWVTDRGFDNLNFFLWGLLRDGVSLFWMIQGYFLMNGRKYTHILKRTVVQVILPAVLVMFCNALLAEKILAGNFSGVGPSDFADALKSLYMALISWNATMIPCCPHLWYVFVYLQVILWLPILRLLAENNFARRWVMGISVFAMALNDLQAVRPFVPGPVITPMILSEAAFFVLLGYEVRLYKEKRPIPAWGGVIIFVVANLTRFGIQKIIFHVDGNYDNQYFMNNTGTLIGMAAALGLFLWLSSVEIKSKRAEKIWRFLGGTTYYIYLIHWLIVQKLYAAGLNMWLYEKTRGMFAGGIVSLAVFTAAAFGIAFAAALLIKAAHYLLRRVIRMCFLRKAASAD